VLNFCQFGKQDPSVMWFLSESLCMVLLLSFVQFTSQNTCTKANSTRTLGVVHKQCPQLGGGRG
jgi:hypothetical protein